MSYASTWSHSKLMLGAEIAWAPHISAKCNKVEQGPRHRGLNYELTEKQGGDENMSWVKLGATAILEAVGWGSTQVSQLSYLQKLLCMAWSRYLRNANFGMSCWSPHHTPVRVLRKFNWPCSILCKQVAKIIERNIGVLAQLCQMQVV